MFLDLLRLATTNLLRARIRLVITASGVLIGTTAVILLIGLTIGLQEYAESTLGDNYSLSEIFVSNSFTSDDGEETPKMTFETIERFRQIEGVETVIMVVPLSGSAELRVGRLRQNVQIVGFPLDQLPYLDPNITLQDIESLTAEQVIIGDQIPDSFLDSNDDSFIAVSADILNEEVMLVIANHDNTTTQRLQIIPTFIFFNERYDLGNTLFLSTEQVLSLNEWITGEPIAREEVVFDDVLVLSTGRAATLSVVTEIEEMGFLTDSLGDYLQDINNFFNLMRLILGSVGGVALLIASFGVANTMMVAILERTSEIGVMKAIGARNRDVLLVFLLEAGLVGLIGGIFGVGFSLVLQRWLNHFLTNIDSSNPLIGLIDQINSDIVVIPYSLLIFAVILAACVGVLAGIIPASRAARIEPAIALKQE